MQIQRHASLYWDDTYHMIAPTSFMTISFSTLKNSNISLALSPILPMMTPKATKNPIKPGTQNSAGLK